MQHSKTFFIKIATVCFLGLQIAACGSDKPADNNKLVRIGGKTMGSGYNISYLDSAGRDFKSDIELFLQTFNQQASTYDSSSVISQINSNQQLTWAAEQSQHLRNLISISQRIAQATDSYFNPAVKPLVNYWGFGYKIKKPITEADTKVVDSLLQLADFSKIGFKAERADSLVITKTDARIQIEFNAIAPGYAADQIGLLLEQKGIKNYLVEVGGEIIAKGSPNNRDGWKVGINRPVENGELNDVQAVVSLQNIALATSGNYRNFYEKGGKKYVHTINPKTGYTEQNKLLSVSVFAPTAAEADAYATAFMAMGLEKSTELIPKLSQIKVFLIFVDEKMQPTERYMNGAEALFLE